MNYLCFTGFVGVIVQLQLLNIEDIFDVIPSTCGTMKTKGEESEITEIICTLQHAKKSIAGWRICKFKVIKEGSQFTEKLRTHKL